MAIVADVLHLLSMVITMAIIVLPLLFMTHLDKKDDFQ